MEFPMNGLNWRALLTLPTLIFLSLSAPTQTAQNSHRERFANADVRYDWVANGRGQKLRTFISRPKNASTTRVPLIFFVGWLSCDSMEYPNGAGKDGFGKLM